MTDAAPNTGSGKRNELTGFTQVEVEFLAAYAKRGFKSAARSYMDTHPDASYETGRSHSKDILRRPHVAAYLAEIQEELLTEANCSLSDHLMALARLRELALDEHEHPSAVKAEELRGRASGHYVEKHHHSGNIAQGFDPAKLAKLPKEDLDTLASILEKLQ